MSIFARGFEKAKPTPETASEAVVRKLGSHIREVETDLREQQPDLTPQEAFTQAQLLIERTGDLALHLLKMAMAVEGALGIRETDPNKSGVAMQEILWVYLNLADRSLFGLFGPAVRDKAMRHMDVMLPEIITRTLCSKWPEDLQWKHVQEFADNMRSTEAEYGNLKVTFLPREDDVFMRCALNVVRHIGHPNDCERALPLCLVLMKTYTDMPMSDCVRGLGNALRG